MKCKYCKSQNSKILKEAVDIRYTGDKFKLCICSDCGIKFVEKPGDDWAFLLLLDRAVFIFPIIAIYYLSIDTITVFTAVIIGVFFMISFIIFTPQRLGVSKAIEYWIRIGRKNG